MYNKLHIVQYICGIVQETFHTSNNETVWKLYKIFALPTLWYGCENWTVQKKHWRKTETTKM